MKNKTVAESAINDHTYKVFPNDLNSYGTVFGGLVMATVATLFFVPAVFAMVRGRSAHGSSAHGPFLSGESHVPAE